MIIVTDENGEIIPTETVTEFKVGDIIQHIRNYNHGLQTFFVATQYDVDNFSGKNGIYIKMIRDEEV